MAVAATRANGIHFSCGCSFEAISMAAAPSLMPDAFPAVTVDLAPLEESFFSFLRLWKDVDVHHYQCQSIFEFLMISIGTISLAKILFLFTVFKQLKS